MERIKLVFVWSKKNYFLSDSYTDTYMYHFFMKRLKEHPELDVTYVETESGVDCLDFKDYDALLFYSAHVKFTPYLRNMRELGIPKFAMSGDSHNYDKQKMEMEEYGEDVNYFFTNTPEYFYKYAPDRYKYKQIIVGMEEEMYSHPMKWKSRNNKRILNTGLLLPKHHELRKMCNVFSDYVKYVPKKDFVGDKFAQLLMSYRAAISASTQCFTLRHIEVAMAGCVPFLEVTEQNGGESLGYTDGVNAVFINEDNYKRTFRRYTQTKDDPKWKEMALKAREFVMNNYTTVHGVNKLAEYIKEKV